jgi:hypothetical protein
LDNAALKALLSGPQSGLYKDMLRRGLKVESKAKQNISGDGGTHPKRVDTGRLRSSVITVMVTFNNYPAAEVGTNVEYALEVHDGTGIHGPNAAMIVPVNKKVLRWKTKGPTGKNLKKKGKQAYTFSMKSSGMLPNPFLKDALIAAKG